MTNTSKLVPVKGVSKSPVKTELATFAAGCFWGVEHEFRKEKGVLATAVGYMGGRTENPTYKQVCYEDTGHAEVVQLEFDPDTVTYTQLLDLFWNLHDPTTLNRQGPDVGDQYRSAVFFHSPAQREAAAAVRDRLQASGEIKGRIVTEITAAPVFYKAEEYHPAGADELLLSRAQLAQQGFGPVANQMALAPSAPDYAAHSLPWPVPFEDAHHTIGNVMTQFQDYGGGAYYHGGDDLRVQDLEWVTAPITGKLEAGHYGYNTNADGSNTKFWKAWPQTGDHMYFEVALIDEQGYRFELHHIDRDSLPAEIVAALNAGGGTIAKGTRLGRVVHWPNSDTDDTIYNHTHYNIVAPDGIHLNPEHYSALIGDNLPPDVSQIYAVGADGRATEFGDGRLSNRPDEVVVVASDKLGENIYTHTPAYSRVVFENGAEQVWDFRERLATADGKFPPIWEFLRESLTTPSGEVLRTQGDYSSRSFLLRLRLPKDAHGKFRVEIGDATGNVTVRNGEVL
ncbi:MAG: peptide-methionine (S)-S-oxide reductase MsrA [Deltaproteobacteria bacterium]|nr:peptide-methionine (S)-S-oxide reductase MsrA [Deltaproteobacteria bacterium]